MIMITNIVSLLILILLPTSVTFNRYDNDTSNDNEAVQRLRGGIREVFSNAFAFAALTESGAVVTWGDARSGGDSSAVAGHLAGGVRRVFNGSRTFVALKEGGSAVAWGDAETGGDASLAR